MPRLFSDEYYKNREEDNFEEFLCQCVSYESKEVIFPPCPLFLDASHKIKQYCKSKVVGQVLDYFFEHYYYTYHNKSITFFSFSPDIKELLDNNKELLLTKDINIDTAYALNFAYNEFGSCLISQKILYNISLKKHSWFDRKKTLSFYINDDYDIKYHLNYGKAAKVFPELTLKKLVDMSYQSKNDKIPNPTKDFFFQYFSILSKSNYLIKDLLADMTESIASICVPIKFSELQYNYNKTMLLQSHNIETYKRTNQYSLCYSYSLAKTKKYIEPRMFNRFLQIEDFILKNRSENICFIEYNRVPMFFLDYYLANISFQDKNKNTLTSLISDYINLVLLTKTTFNLNIKTLSGLKKQHDKLVEIQLKKEEKVNHKSFIKTGSVFDKLILPSQFVLLKSKCDLKLEAMKQRNCVETRITSIKENLCRIFCFDFEDKHYTLDIRYKKSQFYIAEMQGTYNVYPDKKVFDYVNMFLDKINREQAIKAVS